MKRVSKKTQMEWVPLKKATLYVEREHIIKTLIETGFNLQHTSRLLGIARNTLKTKMDFHNIRRKSER